MRIGFIGSSPISRFHVDASKKNGFEICAIGTRKNSKRSYDFAKNQNLLEKYCENGWEQVLDYDLDAYCICVETKASYKILEKALDLNKPILIEKPLAYDIDFLNLICSHPNQEKIFVAYNRRYYKTVNELKNICKVSNGGTIYVNVPDSKRGIKNFLSNGCHMVDALIYIIGNFEIKETLIRSERNDIDSITSICENKKWKILFNAHSLIPANFSITINSDEKVLELKPLEKLSIYEGLDISEPCNGQTLRQYTPKLKKNFFESSKLKPGFQQMYKAFSLFIKGDLSKNLCTTKDAMLTLKKCLELTGNDMNLDIL